MWVSGVNEGSQENVGLRVLQENPANVENQGSQGLMGHQVLPAPVDRRDILDHPASLVFQVAVDLLACLERRVSAVLWAPMVPKVLQDVRVTKALRE